jgi:DNA repair protein RadA/Sms
LGIALAVASSLRDQPVREDTVFFGEVGLTGEVRAVGHLERRIEEAARLGFGRAVVPRHGLAARSRPLEVVAVDHLSGAFAAGFCPPGARVSSSEERG